MKILTVLFALLLTSTFLKFGASVALAENINLSWDLVTTNDEGLALSSPITGYNIYISSLPIKATWPTTLAPIATAPTPSRVITLSGGKYYAVVTAVNDAGESLPSNEITFDVRPRPPYAPTNLKPN